MNNLKEKIEKALDKCDVVVVSGVCGVGKSTLLKEIAKERHIHYSNPTYNCIKFSIKHSDLIAIDDVRETELKNVIQRIQDAVAKTNIKTKAIIVVDKFDKSVLDSVVLRIKHYRMVKPKAKGVLPKTKVLNNILHDQNKEKIDLEASNHELEQALSQCMNQIQTYKNTIAVYEDRTILLEKANEELVSYLNEKVHCLKEELDNEAEETGYYKDMSDELLTEVKWLKNSIELYRGEVDEDTIRRVEYTVQQLRESFGDDYEV